MPSYRTTPDGKDYRLVITVTDDGATCVIERAREGAWVPVQTWTTDATVRTRAPERRLKITESAADHGWQVPADAWGPIRHGRIVVETIHPAGWACVVADATRRRDEALAQLGTIDLAWRDVLADAASIGHLSAATIAEVAGVSRGRVYQLREERRERVNALDAGRSLAQRRKS